MQWLSGCNGVRVPATGTFNLLPLETNCTGGSGVQVLQVPFPSTLPVSDPQATTTTVNLNDYYVELRTAGGIFDTFSTTGGRGGGFGGGGTTFTAPTVFIYASDNVRVPPAMPTGRGGGGAQNSVWTELINTTPSGTPFTGLTAAGQSFTDSAGGATITLQSISATGASVTVTYPDGGTGSPTCIDGTALTAPGPASCAGSAAGTGGTSAMADRPAPAGRAARQGPAAPDLGDRRRDHRARRRRRRDRQFPHGRPQPDGRMRLQLRLRARGLHLPSLALGCLLIAGLARRRRKRTRTAASRWPLGGLPTAVAIRSPEPQEADRIETVSAPVSWPAVPRAGLPAAPASAPLAGGRQSPRIRRTGTARRAERHRARSRHGGRTPRTRASRRRRR